jgi:AcrR family transcriptional regulator
VRERTARTSTHTRPASVGPGPARDDRRVRRTTRSLIQALVDLALEKGYSAITVQDLLDHADVGRSTFYAHYRGKDDLVLNSFERMLEGLDAGIDQGNGAEPRLAPVRELFEHVGGFNQFHRAMARGGMLDRLYCAGTATLARTIAARLAGDPAEGGVPDAIAAQALAGAIFALLRNWVEAGESHTPEEMDRMFHALAPRRRGTGPKTGQAVRLT